MSRISFAMAQAAAGAVGEALVIEDVFSTYLYTGNGSTQTITNGIDLAGEGGLVWLKSRSVSQAHRLVDSARNLRASLLTNSTSSESNLDTGPLVFNSDGFNLPNASFDVNTNGTTYASWTFRKAPRFFDVVTYTGNSVAGRQIAHNLGTDVGTIFLKCTSHAGQWSVWHRSLGTTGYLQLQSTSGKITSGGELFFGNNSVMINPTSSVFTVGTDGDANLTGRTYVAYLFAHDPLGPSGDGSDGLIACGGFTASASVTTTINLGWEPQWVLVKDLSTADNWYVVDNMRGVPFGTSTNEAIANILKPNSADSEFTGDIFEPTATGFQRLASHQYINGGNNYIYIAIRRGPMREPTSGTEVFSPILSSGGSGTVLTTNFPVDLQIASRTAGITATTKGLAFDRLRGVSTTSTGSGQRIMTHSQSAELALTNGTLNWGSTGFEMPGLLGGASTIFWNFRRAFGFFDVVAYTGGSPNNKQIPHNLGVVPELIIQKLRSDVSNWHVWCGLAGQDYSGRLNLPNPFDDQTGPYYFGTHTDTYFSVGYVGNETNISGSSNIAYLFATLPGISKVGSYTGNGGSQTIGCDFTTGARFVLIKRTDTNGDWYVWDTARGIVTGNDPHLSLNTTDAEVTTNDSIDPDSGGFIVNQVAATNINVNAATYIYLAIA